MWIGLALLFSVGMTAASHAAGWPGAAFKTAQTIGDEIDPIQLEEDCRRFFPGTHYDPETGKCKSDWDGDYQNPEGSLFDIWPLGFDRDPGRPAYDDHLAGKKYLLIHHENPGWDAEHDRMIWEIVHFGENGFMERRLFLHATTDWDDPGGRIQVLGRWQGVANAGTPIMRVIIYSFTISGRTHTGFSIPRFHYYDASLAGELLLFEGMILKIPLSAEGDDIPPPLQNDITFQSMTDIETLDQKDPESAVRARNWGAIKAGLN